MDYGTLSSYFDGVAAKTLSGVDLSANKSHQHEFNGSAPLRRIFGEKNWEPKPTTFAFLCDEAEPTFDHGFTTWYNARRKNPKRKEYRLYYSDNSPIKSALPGDLMVIAIAAGPKPLVLFARSGSTAESQIRWLFGLVDMDEGFNLPDTASLRVDAMAAQILEAVGVEVIPPTSAEDYLEDLIARFGASFPKGLEFSKYSASTLGDLDWINDPDGCLLACYNREEMLFRVFERHLLEHDLAPFLTTGRLDVDGVLKTTMSAFQRRKSRAGAAFENQIAMMLDARNINYSSQGYTEGKSKPDFIFPAIESYWDAAFPAEGLTMLGAKTTIKERWRQVLEEADRINEKHLITLEPAVSSDYTDAMRKNHLQLVVPKQRFGTYTEEQRRWLMSVQEFCELVEYKQRQPQFLWPRS